MIAVADGTRELPWLTVVVVILLVAPALARPTARRWVIVFVAALALWLGLWTLPALWPGQRWLGERWNWSGSLLTLSGTLWVGTLLVRRAGLTWREMGFTWAQKPGSILPALGVASAALAAQVLLTISSRYPPAAVSPETWLYQSTLPGLVEETIFRGVLLALLDRAFPARSLVFGASIGWGGVVVTLGFVFLHPLTASSLLAVLPPAVLYLWLRARTGSLALPVLVHNSWNVLAYLTGQ
ncbi:MAG: CPBP family intramembrane glutamic endopeptidase [Caldimonas sp.]